MSENYTPEMQALVEGVKITMEKLYVVYQAELDKIIADKVTDIPRIEALFDQMWVFVDDERIHELYWKLINYVETFDCTTGAFYRRIEELHFEGY